MQNFKEQLTSMTDNLTVNQKEKLKTYVLLNLLEKIENLEDEELEKDLSNLVQLLVNAENMSKLEIREYLRAFSSIKKTVRTKYHLIAKGELVSEYMAMGIGLGLIFGVVMMSINNAFIAIGLPIGVGAGLAYGSAKEKKEQEQGHIY
jgi:hypothetical protein